MTNTRTTDLLSSVTVSISDTFDGGNIKFVEAPPEEATMRFFQSRYVNEEYWKGEITGLPSGHVAVSNDHHLGRRRGP